VTSCTPVHRKDFASTVDARALQRIRPQVRIATLASMKSTRALAKMRDFQSRQTVETSMQAVRPMVAPPTLGLLPLILEVQHPTPDAPMPEHPMLGHHWALPVRRMHSAPIDCAVKASAATCVAPGPASHAIKDSANCARLDRWLALHALPSWAAMDKLRVVRPAAALEPAPLAFAVSRGNA
jgi:hypothetical protein